MAGTRGNPSGNGLGRGDLPGPPQNPTLVEVMAAQTELLRQMAANMNQNQ